MLPLASQTTGPNELNFIVDTHGWPGGVIRKKIDIFFLIFSPIKFFSRATPDPLASFYIIYNYLSIMNLSIVCQIHNDTIYRLNA